MLLLALRLLPLTKRLGPWGIEETDHLEIARTLGRSGNMGWNFQLFVRILYGPIYWTRSQGQSLALEKTISSRAFRYTLRVPNLLRCLAASMAFVTNKALSQSVSCTQLLQIAWKPVYCGFECFIETARCLERIFHHLYWFHLGLLLCGRLAAAGLPLQALPLQVLLLSFAILPVHFFGNVQSV